MAGPGGAAGLRRGRHRDGDPAGPAARPAEQRPAPDREADLRYALIRAREKAEAIAVAGASPALAVRLHARLGAVVRNQGLIIRVTRNLVMFFTAGYNYLIQVIPLLIVAPLYFANKVEFGVVTQAAMAFGQVLGACR